jgi:hypothetical protein
MPLEDHAEAAPVTILCGCGYVLTQGGPACMVCGIAFSQAAAIVRTGELLEVIKALRRGSCWCGMGIGNPMVRQHSPACERARLAVEAGERSSAQAPTVKRLTGLTVADGERLMADGNRYVVGVAADSVDAGDLVAIQLDDVIPHD